MLVRFFGTRGSLPAPLSGAGVKAKIRDALVKAIGQDLTSPEDVDRFMADSLDFAAQSTYGGDSSCVEIDADTDSYIVCDAGSGLREFGNRVMRAPAPGKQKVFNLFMSHVHWDHIMGFPFFVPAYIPGNRILIHGCHDVAVMKEAFNRQQSAPCFPVNFGQLGSTIEFVQLEAGKRYDIAGVSVTTKAQNHSGDSYGYRFEQNGRSVVYSTDSEHKLDSLDETDAFIAFFHGADLVIFDAMYSLADAFSIKEDWGHSSNIVAVELCQRADAKRLALFHHDPNSDDVTLSKILDDTIRFEDISDAGSGLEVMTAYDGLEVTL
ncbi:MAG: MBL fold metallo-hydrolase [Rhodospirillaceae bacterium]|nr:MBL fold metallo-hydrolase [Rhodospirillaceae bacterium]|tara:strand:- start:452 stop:1417 length:966 start_codon:yes stop_codon:yes gene_type:complete